MQKLKRLKVSEVKLDAKNANKGTKRGREFIEGSLKKYGLGRSILLDKDGSVIAGNKTLEAFKKAGGKEIIVVGSNGNQLIAVQREDLALNSKKGRNLAIADNRSTELDLEWDKLILASLDIDLKELFDESQIEKILNPDDGGVEMKSGFAVMIEDLTEEKQTELIERFIEEKLKCRALTF